MTRKSFLFILPALCAFAFTGLVASAQVQKHREAAIDEHVKELSARLNLNAGQQNKLRSILEDQQQEMGALRKNQALSPADHDAKLHGIRETTVNKIRGILNGDQQKQYDQMRAERRQRLQKDQAAKAK